MKIMKIINGGESESGEDGERKETRRRKRGLSVASAKKAWQAAESWRRRRASAYVASKKIIMAKYLSAASLMKMAIIEIANGNINGGVNRKRARWRRRRRREMAAAYQRIKADKSEKAKSSMKEEEEASENIGVSKASCLSSLFCITI
jgi:hypothetical protein